MIIRTIIFLVINFAALAIGGLFTGAGVTSDWYLGLSKAPWTPPGWVFGTAWSIIMICLAFYMSYLWPNAKSQKVLVTLFGVQLALNILWNPIFFHFQNPSLGLVNIISLTALVGFFFIYYYPILRLKSLLIAPYFLWLLIATSLNVYIVNTN